MADSRSGADQSLSINGVEIGGPDHGFSGLSLPIAGSTFTNESGGLSTVRNSGTVVGTASFTVMETEATNRALLGKTGRASYVWESGGETWTMDVIQVVSRNFADRGARSFSVAITIDGAPTIT